MTLVRVTVAGTIGKAVRINPDATIGSQIGVDFQLPDGDIPTLEGLADALYEASPPGQHVNVDDPRGSIFESEIVDGLLLARVADNEVITGAYTFNTNLTMGSGIPINWNDSGGFKREFVNLAAGSGLGAEVGHAIVKSFASQQATSGTYVNKTGATIAHASLDDNEDYLIYVRATHTNLTSVSTTGNGIRLTYNGVVVSGGEKLWEGAIGITNTQGQEYSWSGIISSGTAGDIQLQFKSGNGSDTIDVGYVTILAIKVSDLILNTNIWFDADVSIIELDDGNFPPTNYQTLGAGITIGDGVSDYLVFGAVWVGDFVSGANIVEWRVRESAGNTIKEAGKYEMGDLTDEFPRAFMQLYKAQAATTLTIEATGSGWPVDAKRSFIAAIRLNAFAEHFTAYDADPDESAWSFGVPVDVATIAETATITSTNWGFIAAVTDTYAGSGAGESTILRLDINGAGDSTIGGDGTWKYIADKSNRRQTRFMVGVDQSISSGQTIAADLNVEPPASPTSAGMTEALAVAFTWELRSDSFKVGNVGYVTDILGTVVNVLAPLTATSYDGVLAANLLDKIAAETISGDYTFTGLTTVPLARIAGSTFHTLQEVQDIFHSGGHTSGGAGTDAGGNLLNVAAGTGLIRATNDPLAELLFFDWPAVTGLSVPLAATRFVGIEYNAGNPQAVVRATENWDYQTDFPLAVVTNEDGTIYVSTAPHAVGDHASMMIRRNHETMGINRDNHEGGLILGVTGTLKVTVSAGALWDRLNRAAISAIDTSAAGTFNRYRRDGSGGQTVELAQTDWDNDGYDDNSGGVAVMTNNRYAVQWWYLTLGGTLLCQYGQAQYTSRGAAEAEQPPSDISARILEMSSLIGRFVFQKSDATPVIETVFDTAFGGAQVQDHGNLAGLADDDHAQYLLVDGSRSATVFDVTGALTALSYGGITEANLLDKSATESISGAWTFDNNVVRFRGTSPRTRWIETGGTVDEGAWQMLANTDQFLFGTLADDETGGNSIFLVTRTGTTPDDITFFLDTDISGALTATSYGGITEANLLDKTAAELISGVYKFSTGPRTLNNIFWRGEQVSGTSRPLLGITGGDVVQFGTGALATQIEGVSVNVNAALTATSYGGITEANLVDKAASEVITGAREWQGNVGFYSTTPIAKQTGVAVTAAGIHAALVNLGLIT